MTAVAQGEETQIEGEATSMNLEEWLKERNVPDYVMKALHDKSIAIDELLKYTCDD